MSLQICTVAGIYLRWIIRIYCVLSPYVKYCKEKTSVFSDSIQALFSHFLVSLGVVCARWVRGWPLVSTSLSLHLTFSRQGLLFNLEPSGWLHWLFSKLPGPATAAFLCDCSRAESGPHALKGTLYSADISQPGL